MHGHDKLEVVGDRVADAVTRSLVERRGKPRLVVLGGEMLATHALPEHGSVVIGRGTECEIRIDDPSISRRHVALHLGPELVLEELGSHNGTQVRGEALAEGRRVAIGFDEMFVIGSVHVVVQHHMPISVARQRTLWGHGYFELRLEDECVRARRAATTFALLRVRAEASAVDRISTAVRDVDVIGTYAPGEWEILLLDASREDAARTVAAIREAVPAARVASAVFPADGGDAWALGAAAAAGIGEPAPRAVDQVVPSSVGPMAALLELVDRVAIGDISVLILGETGVGKEVIADRIHARSRRAGKPLLKLNCAAVPASLIESELFGYERGAFTGATVAKAGLFEDADGGTVFLDEIGELPATVQVTLLRVLEQREIRRIGALRPRSIDVRFIAATHRDLEAAIAAETFREDLYFRLAGITLDVPSLRDRPEELESLAVQFAARAAKALDRTSPRITPAAFALLRSYRWPGNVRELRNVVERATLLCDGTIDVTHLPEDRMRRPEAAPGDGSSLDAVRDHAGELERRAIEQALAAAHGNQTEAAKTLGISRRTLTNKLNQHGFARPRKKR